MKPWTEFDFSDVVPEHVAEIPGHLAQIAYPEHFKTVMGLFLPIYKAKERSERALALTYELIELNPAYYFVWDFRFEIVRAIGSDVFDYKLVGLTPSAPAQPETSEDGEFVNQFTLSKSKNYQIWNYRALLLDRHNELWYRGEKLIVSMVLEDDAKNFHAWSHLRWVITQSVKHAPQAFDAVQLLADCTALLLEDVFNNSVWAYRFFLLKTYPSLLDIDEELKLVTAHIASAPSNESAWSYLSGVLDDKASSTTAATSSAVQFALAFQDEPLALQFLAEHAQENVSTYYSLLAEKEPFAKSFWLAQVAE